MILLCFREIILGKIVCKGKDIFYTSYPKGESDLKQNYPVGVIYNMFDSDCKKLDTLPIYLQDIYEMSNNPFYIKKVQILDEDTPYQKLFKLAQLNLSKDGFYIKLK